MTLIQIFICIVLLLLGMYGVNYRKSSPLIAFMLFVLSAVGIGLTFAPGFLQRAADFLGVGRGVDLMFYIFILSAFVIAVNLHLRMRRQAELITKLARKIAILNKIQG